MKKLPTPALLLGLLYLCFLGYLASSTPRLPERMATHFDAGGHPDGWMSQAEYVRFMLVFGLAFPLFLPAIIYVGRFLPDRFFRVPNRDYWFAPERRPETLSYLFRHSLWLAPMMMAFVIGIHFSTVRANSQPHVQLSNLLVFAMSGCLLACVGVWLAILLRHFNRVA